MLYFFGMISHAIPQTTSHSPQKSAQIPLASFILHLNPHNPQHCHFQSYFRLLLTDATDASISTATMLWRWINFICCLRVFKTVCVWMEKTWARSTKEKNKRTRKFINWRKGKNKKWICDGREHQGKCNRIMGQS